MAGALHATPLRNETIARLMHEPSWEISPAYIVLARMVVVT